MDIFEYYREYGASELFPDPQHKPARSELTSDEKKFGQGISKVYARALMDMISE